MAAVRETGRALFGDNCSVCHGREAKGSHGFPDLTRASFLWGNTPEAIAETIKVGINSANAKSRVSQMPAFGRDHVLERPDIENVVAYVLSLSPAGSAVGRHHRRGRQGRVHGELRRLPRPRRQGQSRRRLA